MKVKGFGAWPSRNVTSGGKNSSFDEYNRSFKGDPYNLAYKKKHYGDSTGFMDRGVEEYYRVPEMKDTTSDHDNQNSEASASAAAASSAMRAKAGKSRQAVLKQVAALVVGSVVITAGYQASLNLRSQPPIDPGTSVTETTPAQDPSDDTPRTPQAPEENPTQPSTTAPTQAAETSVSWNWSADGTGAKLVIKDSSGNIISEVAATVTTSQTPAGCRTEGRLTHSASASANGQTYTDTRYETLAALGHAFDSGTEVTLADGRTAMDYECTRCHEHFTIANSIDEE